MEEIKLKPRSYQTQIENVAIRENTIIYLPTGSGKTFIAIQLIKRLQESLKPTYSQGGKRTFFLVNNIPLVEQHCKSISTLTALQVVGFSSKDKVDLWKLHDWLQQLEQNQVLVMTAQILCDMLNHDYIQLNRINLLIFDECHAAVKDHPMRQIMRHYENVPDISRPRVIGLTAPLFNHNVKSNTVESSIRDLETTFYAKIVTCDVIDDVFKYCTNPREIIITHKNYTLNEIDIKIDKTLEQCIEVIRCILFSDSVKKSDSIHKDYDIIIKSESKTLDKLTRVIKGVQRNIIELGTYGTMLSMMTLIIKLERIKLKADSTLQATIQYILGVLTELRVHCEKYMASYSGRDKIVKFSSPKLLSLIKILREYSPEVSADVINPYNNELCGIIFVRERITALILHLYFKLVKKEMDELSFLRHDFSVGSSTNPYDETRESLYVRKQNMLVINKFRLGMFNCLICTDVLEEGFDLPTCNLIIRFDELINFRSYIQSKGRGRDSTASYVIMIPEKSKQKTLSSLDSHEKVVSLMNQLLIGKTHNRTIPNVEDIKESYKEKIEPYRYKNSVITIKSAISLLGKYCTSLDNDIFTDPQPIWLKKKSSEKNIHIVSICMPTNSPMKKIFDSPPMSSLREAKQVAALIMCKELHLMGELNDNLLPIDRISTALDDTLNLNLFEHWREDDSKPKKSDGIKRNLYKKEFPACFRRISHSLSENKYYLHILKTCPVRESQSTDDIAFYDMLESDWGYGILTKNEMFPLCGFSLFLSSGEVFMNIDSNNVCDVSKELLHKIKRFHMFLFYEVLNIGKPFLVLDNKGEDNYFFIAPIRKCKNDNFQIDEDSLNKYTTVEICEEPSVNSRRRLIVSKTEYSQAVISPWYREPDSPLRFIVTKVRDDMNPDTNFANPDFESYADYYQTKYKLSLYGPRDQHLLQVKQIGGKMNCLMPRSVTLQSGSSQEPISKRKLQHISDYTISETNAFDEILMVPEFCVKLSFPGILWLKAILLPSTIHRITMLLQAEELRRSIASEAKIGCVQLENGTKWDPLNADVHAMKNFRKTMLTINKKANTEDQLSIIDVNDQVENTKQEQNEIDYEFIKNNINSEFPWNPNLEPIDINRNMDIITIMDIECYDKFVSEKVNLNKSSCSPQHTIKAICAPPHKYDDNIDILTKTPSKLGPQLRTILEAITLSKSNDIVNLERLEVLGDSFLKFSSSLYLWNNFPKHSEGQLTAVKGKLVSNKNLFYCAEKKNLAGRMKTAQFSASNNWLLPAFCMPPKILDVLKTEKVHGASIYNFTISSNEIIKGELSTYTENEINALVESSEGSNIVYKFEDCDMLPYIGLLETRDKTVSDSVEALIGAYLLDSGMEAAFKILFWFGILPVTDIEGLLNFCVKTPYNEKKCSDREIATQLDFNQNKIEEILDYKFGDASLLLQALSHPSNVKNNITECYQRLEFIGDAVLDFLITSYIYENCPHMSPGDITDLRSSLVNNVTFACLVVRNGLHKFILSSNTALDVAIVKFVRSQEIKNNIIDESVIFLLEEDNCSIADYVDVPKALGDIFESLAGAIYFDSGKDLKTVWRVFYKIMHNEIAQFMQNIPKQPVRLLYEQVHASPKFRNAITLDNGRVMVPLDFFYKGQSRSVHGFGCNKKNAKRSAAKIALKILNI